jgi:hypothetical protein
MNTNLDKIALDLYGKIQTRYPNVKIGDENAKVLSKKDDIPNARFFEFEYKENGESLGTIAITLDEDDGIVMQLSGELADDKHPGAFRFIRSFRSFAKDRLLKFDVQNIGKSELDKRDYAFQAKPKEETMEPMMESKLYGTARMSYQDLGEAKLIVKHSQPINTELAAGRTMHIESIYVENAEGERFKYPYKHLNGARALAEHLKAGGNPYDSIGQHITSLSEELAQLRKFKNYVGRNATLSEAMDDINLQVNDRIEAVKKEVHNLQRSTYYTQFAESFTENESQDIPEEILNDWIDRLTIRTFNEDLRTAFPYIFRLVDESSIPVKELTPEDMLGEEYDEDKEQKHAAKTTLKHIKNPTKDDKEDAEHIKPGSYKDRHDMLSRAEKEGKLTDAYNPNSVAATHARDIKMHHRAELKKKAEAGDERAKALLKRAEENDKARRAEFDARMERESIELGEVFDGDKETGTTHKGGKVTKTKHGVKHEKTDYEDGNGQKGRPLDDKPKNKYKKYPIPDPEDQFENFINSIVEDGEQEGENELFSADVAKQSDALNKLKSLISGDLKPGVDGVNAALSLKGIIDSQLFANDYLDGMSDEDDVGTMLKKYLQDLATGKIEDDSIQGADIGNIKEIAQNIIATKALDSGGNETPVGGEEVPPAPAPEEVPPAPAPAPEAVPPAPAPAPEAVPPAPVAEGSDEEPPFDPDPPRKNPVAKAGKHGQGYSTAKHLAKAGLIKAIHNAKKAGADLDTTLDFGHREMTLHDCIEECGMNPADFGFDQSDNESGTEQMLKSISGFWNKEAKNFTIGGTRAKTKIVKDFKNGEFGNASEEDLQQVLHMIDKMDPSDNGHNELSHIKRLAGMHNQETDEGSEQDDFSSMFAQFKQQHPQADMNKLMQTMGSQGGMQMPQMPGMGGAGMPDMSKMMGGIKMPQGGGNSITVNGKPATQAEFDAFTKQHNVTPGQMPGGQKLTPGQMPSLSGGMKAPQLRGNPQDMVNNMMKGMNESAELTAMLKIAGLR